jgi:methyltransferase (TIGR00027 family)
MPSSGPSVTARRVAAYRLGFTRVPALYGDAAADEALAADVAAGEEVTAGGMREYLDARTRFFDRVVVGAIGRGVRQIVLGGAGYDGRAFRYAKSGVRWFEVDRPATQRDKRERLDRLGIATRQVRFVEADFTRDPVAERLTAAGLDPGRPCLFLLEGVAVYLEPAVIERVLREFRQVARAGGRLAISVSRSGAHSEARSRFQASVAALGEPARSALGAGKATELLARTGWQVMTSDDADDPEAVARRDRLRLAGLLTARAGDTTSVAPAKRPPRGYRSAEQPDGPLPTSALLSQALVAFTIELDNETEHRLPGQLRRSLEAVAGRLDPGLPDYLPILGQVLFSRGPDPALPPRPEPRDVTTLPLSALLSRVLLAFALEYEAESAVSLAVGANLLRVLRAEGTRLRDLPLLTGISKEAVAWAVGVLLRARLAVQEPDPAASRGQVARLTPAGLRAQQRYLERLGTAQDRWGERFGGGLMDALRQPLEPLAVGAEGQPPPLFQALDPYPDNWRASVRPPRTLPHHPMVLHRGGYPDGS